MFAAKAICLERGAKEEHLTCKEDKSKLNRLDGLGRLESGKRLTQIVKGADDGSACAIKLRLSAARWRCVKQQRTPYMKSRTQST
jgi:hypothetical protein